MASCQTTAKINFLTFQGGSPGCHVWGQVTWGWSSVVDVLQGQKGIEGASSCAGQCCAAIRLKHKKQEWKVVPWEHPFLLLLQDWGMQIHRTEILETQLNQGKKKKKRKRVLCKQDLLFLATGNYFSAALLNDSQTFHTSPSFPRVSCLILVPGCSQARIKRALV